ncbi:MULTISPECIES: hypothetical protein [Paraburkholderia]|uniref:hypothetical protein n=1 Tax=Paraburkholderia TaxID=1822464 RepID=UPI0022597A70|nr:MULTISPECIES: hypothetical protein [Paraburkholderia]MCX4177501.1 hypothetical protein [Paraburkholderia madseniana]MDQ6465490.1 hypothetical protein [Paraburkholderia madseniana]
MTDEDWLLLKRAVPLATRDGLPYSVRIAVVPQPWQGGLRELIRCESVPVFNDDGQGDCLYAWDWAKWPGGQLYCRN